MLERKSIDKQNMFSILKNFPAQCKDAIEIGKRSELPDIDPRNIIICGMGGSGISGRLARDFFSDRAMIPITLINDYSLPKFCNRETLLIAISYSGNTEEILNLVNDAKKKGCHMLGISSGGKLEGLCKDFIKIPPGLQPRQAIGYMFLPLLISLEKMEIIKTNGMKEAISLLEKYSLELTKEDSIAMKTAEFINGFLPIVYTTERFFGVAYRWETQINENAKSLAYARPFPEHNHNEINALPSLSGLYRFIFLRDKDRKNSIRFEFVKKCMPSKIKCMDIWMEGKSDIAKGLSTIYIGDFTSYYLALLKGIDPTPVPLIEELKAKLKG